MLNQALVGHVESLLEKLKEQFGSYAQLDYHGRGVWRVWVHGWHVHNRSANSSSYGPFCMSGSSLGDAARRLSDVAMKDYVVRGENCEKGKCPYFRDGV